MTPPVPQSRDPDQPHVSFANNGRPTEIWFVQGKKANRAFKASLNRENATLSENPDKYPPTNDKTKDPQRDCVEKEGYDAHLHK